MSVSNNNANVQFKDNDHLLSIRDSYARSISDKGLKRKCFADPTDELSDRMKESQLDPFVLEPESSDDSPTDASIKKVKPLPDTPAQKPNRSQSDPLPKTSILSLLQKKA